tara:strand:+ start:883 stop:1128 length:246 start_codon:yes stop_codon:yes gene_type:complete
VYKNAEVQGGTMSTYTKEDKIRDELFDDLLDATEKAQELGVPQVIWMGITFFTQMAVDCAPTVTDARHLVSQATKSVKKVK